jgi:hypothetical protein
MDLIEPIAVAACNVSEIRRLADEVLAARKRTLSKQARDWKSSPIQAATEHLRVVVCAGEQRIELWRVLARQTGGQQARSL